MSHPFASFVARSRGPRKAFLVTLLLLAGCSSWSALIDSELVSCAETGNEVSVMLGAVNLEMPPVAMQGGLPDIPVTIDVEVSNNTQDDIVVKFIRLIPRNESGARMELGNAGSKFDQTIAEGKDHVFTLRTTGRWRRSITDVTSPSAGIEVETRVELANGQTYRCQFLMPVG